MKNKKLHFVPGKTLFGFIAGALSMIMITGAIAAPSATPPGGNVNANFTSVNTPSIGTTDGTTPVTIKTNLRLDTGKSLTLNGGNLVLNGGTLATFGEFNAAFGLYNTEKYGGTNPLYLYDDLSVEGAIRNVNSSVNGGRVVIDDNLNITGLITNTSTTINNGRVVVADDLEVRGNLVPQTAGGNINVVANLSNPSTLSGNSLPVRVEDDFIVAGNITSTGNIIIDDINAGGNITTTGGNIGSYYTRTFLGSDFYEEFTCEVNTQAVSCDAFNSTNPTYQLYSYLSGNKCYSVQNANVGVHQHRIKLRCFDPSGTLTGETTTVQD